MRGGAQYQYGQQVEVDGETLTITEISTFKDKGYVSVVATADGGQVTYGECQCGLTCSVIPTTTSYDLVIETKRQVCTMCRKRRYDGQGR